MNLITILGQTSSGKTQYSLDLYNKIVDQGEECVIVNCDSRQIYQQLNLGTGKIAGQWGPYGESYNAFWHTDATHHIPHLLLDYIDPRARYSMTDYLQDWCHLFSNELNQFKGTVVLVGGTGLWAKAINEAYQPGIIKPARQQDYDQLKIALNNLSLNQLHDRIGNNHGLNESDWSNPRRLINYILRKTSLENNWTQNLIHPFFETKKLIGLSIDQDQLKNKIKLRLEQRIEEGLVEEVEQLSHLGQRLLELGLEYRLTYLYLKGQLSKEEWGKSLIRENIQYAKRQLTWLSKQHVEWVTLH